MEQPLNSRSAAAQVLTDQQRCFAAKHHNLIYSFLHEKEWPVSEYYDIAVLGFLHAVRRYLTEPDLTRYAFSSIAWPAMSQSIASFHRAEARRKEAELRYACSFIQEDPFIQMETRLILHDLAAVSNREQYELAALRLQGYTISEIAASQGMPKIRVRRILRELYRVYFQLYQEAGNSNDKKAV